MKWFLGEELRDTPFYCAGLAMRLLVLEPGRMPKDTLSEGAATFEEGTSEWFILDKEFRQAGKAVFEKVLSDRPWPC